MEFLSKSSIYRALWISLYLRGSKVEAFPKAMAALIRCDVIRAAVDLPIAPLKIETELGTFLG